MSNSVIPLQQGFDYQARLFWVKVCDLFLPHTKTKSVGYEYDEIKSFDDVVVTYLEPIPDINGLVKHKDFYQSKFHSHQTNPILYSSLIDPKFIGATSSSFLQKLNNAYGQAALAKQTYIYNLFTPSTIHPDDPLSGIYSNYNNILNVELLYKGKTNNSKTWKIRNEWTTHLNITEKELRNLILMLRIINGPSSMALFEKLNRDLLHAGFKPIENGNISNPYDDLVRKLHQSGRNSFTAEDIQEVAKNENLWIGKTEIQYPEEKTIGIRSFIKFAEEMPNLTYDMICLSPNFDDRYIKSEDLWNQEILPKTSAFIEKYESLGETIYVLLDTHTSIAFAAGRSIHPKASTKFVPIQKNEFRQPDVWSVSAIEANQDNWQIEEILNQDNGDQLALAIGVTHPVALDAKDYVQRSLETVNKILSFEVKPKPSTYSVKDGNHAFALAEELAQKVIGEVKNKKYKSIHIFASAPVGFMFYLGKMLRQPNSCTINIYEYDFGSKELGAYTKSITFNQNS